MQYREHLRSAGLVMLNDFGYWIASPRSQKQIESSEQSLLRYLQFPLPSFPNILTSQSLLRRGSFRLGLCTLSALILSVLIFSAYTIHRIFIPNDLSRRLHKSILVDYYSLWIIVTSFSIWITSLRQRIDFKMVPKTNYFDITKLLVTTIVCSVSKYMAQFSWIP